QEYALALIACAHQMQFAWNHPKKPKFLARNKKANAHLLRRICPPLHAQSSRIALANNCRHPRIKPATIKQIDALDLNEGLSSLGLFGILCAEKIGAQHNGIHDQQDDGTEHCQPMFAETPPHKRPVRCHRNPLFGRSGLYCHCGHVTCPSGYVDPELRAGCPTTTSRQSSRSSKSVGSRLRDTYPD